MGAEGGGTRVSHVLPLAPFSSVNKQHAFTLANGRGQSSGGGLMKAESWALASSHTSASQVHRWRGVPIAARPQAKEPREPRAGGACWPHCKWHWFWGQHVPRGPSGVPARSALKLCPESGINIPRLLACQPADLPLRRPSGQRSRVCSRPLSSWCRRDLTREIGPLSPEPQTRCLVGLTPGCYPLAVQLGSTKKQSRGGAPPGTLAQA